MAINFRYETLTSRKNRKVVDAASLSDKKNREEIGLFAVEGKKLFEELLLTGIEPTWVFFTEKASDVYAALLENAAEKGAEMYLVTDEVFDKLTDEKAPQGIFACGKLPGDRPFDAEYNAKSGYLILDSVRDPGNVGTAIRTAASLGLSDIILTGGCADVWSKKALRAAMGAVFRSNIFVCDDACGCIEALKAKGHRVFAAALTEDAMEVGDFDFAPDDCIVIGNEGHGLSDEIVASCTSAAVIPMQSGVESLNASAAAAILIWEKMRGI